MSENNQTLPPLENSPEELEAQRIRERDHELRQYWLDPREDYPEPYYMLEYNGVPFSTVGGIQAITGQKKNGKTFVLTMLMAAVLGRGSRRVEEYLPGLTCPQRTVDYLGHEPSVLFVDTEMEKLSSAKVLRRVHWLCDWDMKMQNDRFHVLWLRQVTDENDAEKAYAKRWRLVKSAIESLSPDFVIIDGLRDIMASINDEDAATAILTDLSAMAERRQMCIWTALHYNPRPGNDQESKMRGWAGTELGNKASDTFVSIKQKRGNEVYFSVRQADARNKDVDEFTYQVTDDAGNLGIPRIMGNGVAVPEVKREPDSVQDITRWIREAQERMAWPMSRKDVKQKVFGEIGGQRNKEVQQLDLTLAMNNGLLVESTLKANGYYQLMPADDLPF